MRLINICFHHTAEDITVWHDFAKYLSEKLNEEFSIVSYKSLREEQEALLNEEYDLAFQNPETAQLLFSKGYVKGKTNPQ